MLIRQVNDSKGFIQIPLLIVIIAGVLVLGVGGYFGLEQYQNYQAEKVKQGKVVQEQQKEMEAISDAQQKALEDTRQEIEKLRAENQEDQQKTLAQANVEIEKLRVENQETKNKQTEIEEKLNQDKGSSTPPPVQSQEINLPSIIEIWRPRVAYIECEFHFADTGQIYLTQGGSGFLWSFLIFTNKHVLFEDLLSEQKKYAPYSCRIKLPDDPQSVTIYYQDKINGEIRASGSLDFGAIKITNPTTYMQNLIASAPPKLCNKKAVLGDKILILGYPGIGAKTDITATEGIVSGYEGDFYITSAKVEHGNSGGVAILLSDNCYLGIPTFVRVGEVETLARILNVQTFAP